MLETYKLKKILPFGTIVDAFSNLTLKQSIIMKKVTNLLLILLFLLVLQSCDNESVSEPLENNTQLTSITEVFTFDNNQIGATTTYTVNGSLNTQINYEGGAYSINTFTDGKVTFIEFFNNGTATGTEEYEYDSNDRMLSRTRSFPSQNEFMVTDFEYIGNQIFVTETNYNSQGNLVEEDNYSFTLNADNQIIHYQNDDNTAYWDATYANGNLIGFSASGYGNDADGTATFTYSTDLASIPYQKERFRFGSEWRNNVMLRQIGSYAFKQLAELGSNYLTGYTYTITSDPTKQITLDVTYEFDDSERLTKQTKNKMFYESLHSYELTYQYQ